MFGKLILVSVLVVCCSAFWDPDVCWDYPEVDYLVHENCDQYYVCDDDRNLVEGFCDVGEIFDEQGLFCGTPDEAICWNDDGWQPEDESECPQNSNEVVFLPGEYCDEYYICIGGQPQLFECRAGQHWNEQMNYCDDPHMAGCDENAVAEHPSSLPECNAGVVGSFPHPHNCNWFIYCSNGNRSIQQCQHLFHYDVNQNRCLFQKTATCIKDV